VRWYAVTRVLEPDSPGVALRDRLVEIRHAFDSTFAQPPAPPGAELVGLLAVRASDVGYAVRLSAVAGLFTDRPVTYLPGAPPGLLGVAGFRGAVVAVYHLGALLGHPATGTPRWLVLDAGSPAVALAFDGVEGLVRVPAQSIARAVDEPGSSVTARGYAREMVAMARGPRPVVDLVALRAAIERR
jgi:chemotaxis signal transduction protein